MSVINAQTKCKTLKEKTTNLFQINLIVDYWKMFIFLKNISDKGIVKGTFWEWILFICIGYIELSLIISGGIQHLVLKQC